MSWVRSLTVFAVAAGTVGALASTSLAQTCTPGTGDRCVIPGQIVSCDASGDQDPTLGSTQDDIQQVSIAESPGAATSLIVTIKVAALNVDSLPLNHLWRVLWDNPLNATTYFVSMLTCDVTQQPSFDYGFIDANGIQASQGTSQGTYASDGTIRITIGKSLVGSPVAGTVLGNVVGNTRLIVGAQCTGSIQPIDASDTGSYTVIGSCPPPPPLPGASPCILPGLLVQADPAGDADVPPVPDARFDLRSISLAEPYGVPIAGGDVLVFTIKVADLSTLPPNGFWRIIFASPSGPNQYVRMINCAVGGVTFDYGHFTTGSVSDGACDAGSYTADGTIKITLAKSKLLGGFSPGFVIGAVNADARESVGNCPGGPAAFPPVDVTAATGSYTLVGNNYCKPHTVTCPPSFVKVPGDTTISFVVNNPSTTIRTFTATITGDAQGWIVGGPIVNVPVTAPAGGSGTLAVALHLPSICDPQIDDPMTWTVNASDLPPPDNQKSCSTTPSCYMRRVGVGDEFPQALAFSLMGSNPFHGRTAIAYALPERSPVRIDVYNVAGQRVRTLVDRIEDRGNHSVMFNLRDDRGRGLGAGVYLVRITAGTESRSLRIIGLN